MRSAPEFQSDGLPSAGLHRSYVERALRGARPVFEWLHRDGAGKEIPCEVRFIRLPSSKQRLIRASILDNARGAIGRHRWRTASGAVLELVAANARSRKTLLAVVRLIEQLHPGVSAAINLLDAEAGELCLAAANGLSAPITELLAKLPGRYALGLVRRRWLRWAGKSSCATWPAIRLGRARRRCCRERRAPPAARRPSSRRATACTARSHCTSTAVRNPEHRRSSISSTRLTQLAGIAIRRKQDETALRDSEARFRSLFDNVVDGVYQAAADRRAAVCESRVRSDARASKTASASRRCNLGDFFVDAKERSRLVSELQSYGRVRHFEYQLRRDGPRHRRDRELASRDDKRTALYFEGTITDITQRKAAERALFNEKERAQVDVQSIGDASSRTDAHGNIEYLNPVAEQLTGWESREAQGMPIESIIALRTR